MDDVIQPDGLEELPTVTNPTNGPQLKSDENLQSILIEDVEGVEHQEDSIVGITNFVYTHRSAVDITLKATRKTTAPLGNP